MPDILLFGATGFTGRLTAKALARRGASFAIAGRDRRKLEALARVTGEPQVRVAEVGDVEGLAQALEDVKVLITCVGPFVELGETAVEAALRAKVHYIDSTGEGVFIERLLRRDPGAREAGIAMAPAMGFDEVPGDVVAALAAEGLERPEIEVTYALPATASLGTVRSALGIAVSRGPWIEGGRDRMIGAGEETRWAPMPPPLGPRKARSFPLALGHLAPLHLDLEALRLYVTTGNIQGAAMRAGIPLLKALLESPARKVVDAAIARLPEGPAEEARTEGRWTILAEARSGRRWKNVTAMGADPYGLTARMLSTAAAVMSAPGYDKSGVLAPVQALGVAELVDELKRSGVSFETYAPTEGDG